jgi:hypothetical protein
MWLVAEWHDKKMVWWASFESEAEALEASRSRAWSWRRRAAASVM